MFTSVVANKNLTCGGGSSSVFRSALKALFESKEWKDAATGNGLVPIWRGGEEFEAYVIDQAEQMKQISTEIGVLQ